jgi:hypothetical protein
MLLSAAELAEAKDAAGMLLDTLGLEAYLYQVEPRDGSWEMRVDCATADGWQSLTVRLEKELLLASRTEAAARERVLRMLREKLSA